MTVRTKLSEETRPEAERPAQVRFGAPAPSHELPAPGGKTYTEPKDHEDPPRSSRFYRQEPATPRRRGRGSAALELAVALYGQAILSFGKAAELAGVSRYQFGELVTRRGIPRHYGPDELAEDLAYGRGE